MCRPFKKISIQIPIKIQAALRDGYASYGRGGQATFAHISISDLVTASTILLVRSVSFSISTPVGLCSKKNKGRTSERQGGRDEESLLQCQQQRRDYLAGRCQTHWFRASHEGKNLDPRAEELRPQVRLLWCLSPPDHPTPCARMGRDRC